MADVFNFYVQDDRSIQFNIAEPILLEDKDVTEFQFRIPKSLNGFDMSTWAWWFVYVNPKKEKYSYPLTLTDDEDEPDDYSVATFSINYGITEKEGGLQFALEVIDADAGGNVLHEWHTRTYHTAVIWTLQGNQTEYEEDITQDILSSILEQIAVNKARIDNIARLPEGSTTADAELIDIRVGENGITYPTAGDADGLSVHPEITWTIGKEISSSTGVPTASAYRACSSKIACVKDSRIVNKSVKSDANNYSLLTYVALYNGDTFIRRDAIAYNTTYTVDVDVTAVALTIGRYSTSGVNFTESDLDYFSYAFIIAPDARNEMIDNIVTDVDELITDVEAMQNSIVDLKSAVNNIEDGVKVYKRIDIEKSIGLTSLTDLEVKSSYYYGTTLNKSVKEGEKYKITCGKKSVNLAGLFYAKNGVYVPDTYKDEDLQDEVITVPSGVDTLYLNGSGLYQPVIMKLVTDVNDAVLDVIDSRYGEIVYEEFEPTINNGYKAYANNAERTANITHTSDSGYHYIELDVNPGESYKVTCQAVASSKSYQLLDETDYELSSSSSSLNDTQIDIPSNAYTLLISYYGDITIKKKQYRVANDVTEITQNVTQNTIEKGIFNNNSVSGLINSRAKYRYIWHDNFYREDDSTGLGTNGDSIFPMVYSYTGSQLGIINHSAYNTGSTKGFAYADMKISDCTLEFQADLNDETLTTRGVGVIGRWTDARNYWYCLQRRQYIRYGKCVDGTFTELGNVYIISPSEAPKKVGFEMCGNKLSVIINGVLWNTVYDDFNSTATSHGISFDSGSTGKILNFGVKHEIEWQPMIDTMDSGILPFNIRTENVGQAYNFEVQNSVVNGSETAIRFENRKADNYKRSEIAINGQHMMLEDQVFSFDMMLANEYAVVETLSEIIMQFHDYPDDGDWTAPASQPSFSIFLKNGDYYIHTQWSDDKASIGDGSYDQISSNIGSYLDDIGKWVNWKIHVKWAYNDFFEPLLEVYKDGELVFYSKKPNVINAANGPYFKVGIYTFNYVENPSACVSEKRVMYVDNVLAWY